jgi:protein-disulfide isomerase-like protein with CxxC motif
MVNNKAVETIHQEFKREYASSSFYINGLPTLVMEREGETKRLLSPGDKFARFEEVKYKEYKSMKTSGEGYVQDFISVLEADDA